MTSLDEAKALLDGFILDRVLGEDAKTRSASLLGHFRVDNGPGRELAVLIIEKTHFSASFYKNIGTISHEEKSISRCVSLGSNDVYKWLLGWMPDGALNRSIEDLDAHVKMTMIRPATQAHITKYSEQLKVMITETPEMYEKIILPWIDSQPVERIQWVYNILEKKKEADTILFEKTGSECYIIVPDLKWDQKTLSSLYLIAIVQDRSLRTLRDLTKEHIPLLRDIHEQGEIVARKRFNLCDDKTKKGKLRCFLHYQPTYYHMHVHLLSSDYTSHPGAIVGQAHLLEDVIDLLELGVDFKKRTFTYSIGEQSQLLHEICNKSGQT